MNSVQQLQFQPMPSSNSEPIKLNYFDQGQPRHTVVIVGGSGDNRDSMSGLAHSLANAVPDHDFVTFSFLGRETGKSYNLSQQVQDLNDVLTYLRESGKKVESIICTSQGAFSTCHILVSHVGATIRNAVFLDPADYEIDPDQNADIAITKAGHETESFKSETAASLLKAIKSDCKIDVIRLTIRNYTLNGYVEPDKRGADDEKLHPRLSTRMIKSFYEYTPDRNRGQYLEIGGIPHAFNRDGSQTHTIQRLTRVLTPLL